jgi:hypothetical protein
MTAVVIAQAVLLALLTLLVAGLLRSHAEILRRLDGMQGRAAGSGRELAPGLAEPRADAPTAADVTGRAPSGDALHVAVTRAGAPTLLAFLSSGCDTCQGFWDSLADDRRPPLPGGVELLVVTKGWEEESPSRIGELAAPGVRTVMSSPAWQAYDVPGSPYFVLVDAAGGVAGEGTARAWPQVVSLLTDALADTRLAGGRDDAERADRELAAAGIRRGDPSLRGPAE